MLLTYVIFYIIIYYMHANSCFIVVQYRSIIDDILDDISLAMQITAKYETAIPSVNSDQFNSRQIFLGAHPSS